MGAEKSRMSVFADYFYHSFPEHDASSDVRHVALNAACQSVVGSTADEQMYQNEDKGTRPSTAVLQHNVSETRKGVEQDG